MGRSMGDEKPFFEPAGISRLARILGRRLVPVGFIVQDVTGTWHCAASREAARDGGVGAIYLHVTLHGVKVFLSEILHLAPKPSLVRS
jgi:hypothetical protein